MIILDQWFDSVWAGEIVYLTQIWHELSGLASEIWYNSIGVPPFNRYVQAGLGCRKHYELEQAWKGGMLP